ncbi:hypothetical protein G6F63_014635 [Rhizopus arrhizus]|nr:hypothetical protein G6F63_014635 [Rhizopus arrhizus]
MDNAAPTAPDRIPSGAPILDYSGRRVLIAGGSKGIGREMALAFSGSGAQVSVCARGQSGLDVLRADATAQGVVLHAFAADLADTGQIQGWLQAAADALGGIDVLVNNAGSMLDMRFRQMAYADWSAVLRSNLDTLFNSTKQVVARMAARGWGRIINIGAR